VGIRPPPQKKSFFDSFLASKKNNDGFVDNLYFIVIKPLIVILLNYFKSFTNFLKLQTLSKLIVKNILNIV